MRYVSLVTFLIIYHLHELCISEGLIFEVLAELSSHKRAVCSTAVVTSIIATQNLVKNSSWMRDVLLRSKP